MTICAVCNDEAKIGRIAVPDIGDFPIGKRCYRLHVGALRGAVLIRDFATICQFQPRGRAAEAWLRALLDEMRPIVSHQVKWKKAPEVVN